MFYFFWAGSIKGDIYENPSQNSTASPAVDLFSPWAVDIPSHQIVQPA
jgi:hypothetical protein